MKKPSYETLYETLDKILNYCDNGISQALGDMKTNQHIFDMAYKALKESPAASSNKPKLPPFPERMLEDLKVGKLSSLYDWAFAIQYSCLPTSPLERSSDDERAVTRMQFMECDDCRAKPGSPTLCAGCLHNRAVIEELQRRASKPEKQA